jgi:hypothetical protein
MERWVLSWGTHATVMRPKMFSDRILQVAVLLKERYSESAKPNFDAEQPELLPARPGKTRAKSSPH